MNADDMPHLRSWVVVVRGFYKYVAPLVLGLVGLGCMDWWMGGLLDGLVVEQV